MMLGRKSYETIADMFLLFGLIGALISIVSYIPYILDTLSGSTKPQRVTWGALFLLNIVFLGNHLAAGATNSLWLVIASLASTLVIFALSFKYGVGGRDKLDLYAIGAVLVGVALWLIFDSPSMSIIMNLFVGGVGILPTVKKAYLNPESETKSKWLLGSIGGLLVAISVGELDIVLLLFPVSIFVAQGIIYILLIRNSLFSTNKP